VPVDGLTDTTPVAWLLVIGMIRPAITAVTATMDFNARMTLLSKLLRECWGYSWAEESRLRERLMTQR
jgi:hypothetical protein